MNVTVEKLRANLPYSKVQEWIKLISITGLSQAIIQATSLLCGILIIRLLDPKEYGLYTLANTMLGTMTILADCGIGNAVMAQGGKVWQDQQKLGAVLATGLDLRRKFALGSFLLVAPFLGYLLFEHGATLANLLLILATLLPAFTASLSDSVLEIVPKLNQHVIPLQRNQMSVSINRLLLTALTIFVFPWTFVAILASGLTRLYGNVRLRQITFQFVDKNQAPDPLIRKEILRTVKRVLPENLYYCLSGQLTIWLTSILGSTMALASLGAIGRLGMVLNLFSVVFAMLIVPRFARQPNHKPVLIKYVTLILTGAIFLVMIILAGSWLFADELLWILGKEYQHLQWEMVLSMANSCMALLVGAVTALNVSRGWIINPYLYICISIATTVLALALINVSELEGVLWFNIVVLAVQLVLTLTYSIYRMKRLS